MTCLELRRRLLADPHAASRDAADHLAACGPCAGFVSRTLRLDAEVAAALAVEVPPGLPERIVREAMPGSRHRRRILAAAASVAAISSLVGVLSLRRDHPLALAGIDFVIEEEAFAILMATPADEAVLRGAMRVLGATLPAQMGELRYIGTCPFGGTIAHHVIVTTRLGKVTLLLMPGLALDEPGSAQARGLCAQVRPAGPGCILAIGESRRALERACEMVLRA